MEKLSGRDVESRFGIIVLGWIEDLVKELFIMFKLFYFKYFDSELI